MKPLTCLTILLLAGCTLYRKAPVAVPPLQTDGYYNVQDPHRKDFLTAVGKTAELSYGYVNQKGDTVIPIGKYANCFTTKFRTFAWVYDKNLTAGKVVAIDKNERILFEAYMFDNGTDYTSEGLFRIIRNGKIGFANENGEVVIAPVYACADEFRNGKARVALECTLQPMGEHNATISSDWIHIDKNGMVVTSD